MNGILSAVFFFIVAIGVLVVIHEYGHFLVARICGVKVLRFSIGFGKPLWRWNGRRDNTEYVIAAIPLGGYVKMLDERESAVPANEQGRAFNRQPLYRRFAIVAAGPLFNFLLAVAIYWIIFIAGVPGLKPIVGKVDAAGIAYQGGFRDGDEIVSIAGKLTPTWDATILVLLDKLLDHEAVTVTVRDQAGHDRSRNLRLDDAPVDLERNNLLSTMGMEPFRPDIPPRVDRITAGSAAERSGLSSGDLIIAADAVPVRDWQAWVELVRAKPGQLMVVDVKRADQVLQLQIRPDPVTENGHDVGRIGATVAFPEGLSERLRAEVKYPPVAALGAAIVKTWDMSALTLQLLGKMIVGEVSVTNISGPISIAQYASFSANAGLIPFLGFLAIISVSLAVLNLLPIPMLDGGHLLYFIVEALKGSPVSEQTELLGQRIGIVAIGVLVFVALYNDISRLIN
ncbi:MAG: RIP metalloprotease RseP [Gammaproteobacteria bacterium]|nr:MAG: RIP metalloprotease RseP [Gammaproteobacteria bacterium]TND07097.1 MAG: RIP metalloprotease RseP [Gammaproteobacteria bacterium]